MGIRNYSGSGRVPSEFRASHKHTMKTYTYKFGKDAIAQMWGPSGGLAIGNMTDLYKIARDNTEQSLIHNPGSASFSDQGWSGGFSGSLTGSIDATHTRTATGGDSITRMGCFGGYFDSQFPRTYLPPAGLSVQAGRGWFSGSLSGFFSGSFKGSYPDNFETSSDTVFIRGPVGIGDNETNHFTGSFKMIWSGSIKTLPGEGAPGSGSVVGNYMTGSFTVNNTDFDVNGSGSFKNGGKWSPSATGVFERNTNYFKHYRTGGIQEKRVVVGKTATEVVPDAAKTTKSTAWTTAGVIKGGFRKR